jgi:multiple antibiotic resistance protein
MVEKITRDALLLFATIDPIGTLALFAALTGDLSPAARRGTAFRATLYAAVVLVGAVVVGQIILEHLNIRLISLQVAGGIVLFLFALKMVFGEEAGQSGGEPEPGRDLAVFPLAVPSIASPGAIIAAIVLTDNHLHSVPDQAVTTSVLLTVLAITWGAMLLSGPALRVLGRNGSAILVRIMGLLLAALSVELVLSALGVARWAVSTT